ncbi:hypothetical protein MAP00_002574 [Monascus purpureus]|nr:hypothetical protein MAP00_002574 [Monascus purpureus]
MESASIAAITRNTVNGKGHIRHCYSNVHLSAEGLVASNQSCRTDSMAPRKRSNLWYVHKKTVCPEAEKVITHKFPLESSNRRIHWTILHGQCHRPFEPAVAEVHRKP